MQHIEWTDDLQIGIAFIDDHHKKLIAIANEFIDAAENGYRSCSLTAILTRLREQAVQHFKTEEDIMSCTRYKKRAIHTLENERLKVGMRRFHRLVRDTSAVTEREIQLLKESLITHIQSSNQAINNSVKIQR